ncbi:MAG: hypothetical protein ACRDQA_07540 [Nocardioidaceae bacterium]
MGLVFYEKSHRYKLDGTWCPGVTTLIKQGLPNSSLMYWSARTVAEYVTDHADDVDALRRMGRAPMVNALKEVPWEKRDVAGVQGTDVHDLAECLVHGEQVDVPDHLAGYVDACVDFLDTWKPTPLVVERPLAHRGHWWAGKPDLFAALPDGRTILYDYKTGSGIYESYAYQMVAYSRAEFYVDEHDVEQPIPHVDLCAAVHLKADGYDVVPVLGDYDEIYKEFRHIRFVAQAAKRAKGNKTSPGYIGQPLDLPGQETAA